MLTRWVCPRFVLAGAVLTCGCAGGAPLLHGAHTLGPGSTAMGAGFSGTFSNGSFSSAMSSSPAEPGADPRVASARAKAVGAAIAPGVAPWVSARVGLPGDNEVGLTYMGRSARFDLRHAFEWDTIALSIGVGADALWGDTESTTGTGIDAGSTAIRGYGADVPVVVGWRSAAGVVTLWAGARGGGEQINDKSSSGAAVGPALDLQRWYVGPVIGMALGFRHLHGALELDTYYQHVGGTYFDAHVGVTGVTIAPAGALILTF